MVSLCSTLHNEHHLLIRYYYQAECSTRHMPHCGSYQQYDMNKSAFFQNLLPYVIVRPLITDHVFASTSQVCISAKSST